MSYQPVSGIVPQYSDDSNQLASGFYVKFYIANTTTPLSMATDSTGGTLLTKAKLNPDGLPISNPADNTTVFIPHVDQDYRLVIYRNEADANANNTAGAFLNVPIVKPLAASSLDGGVITYTFDSRDDEALGGQASNLLNANLPVGTYARTAGRLTTGDGEGELYEIVATGGDITLDNGNQAKIVSKVKTSTGTQPLAVALDDRVVRVGSVAEGIAAFSGRTIPDGAKFTAIGWHTGNAAIANPVPAIDLVYSASWPKSEHGETGWSATVPAVSAQSGANLSEKTAAYLSGTGETDPEGYGGFVIFYPSSTSTPEIYGAKGDNSFDDTASIDASVLNNSITILSAKEYRHQGPITLASDKSLMGAGKGATLIRITNNNADGIVWPANSRRVKLSGFALVYAGSGTPTTNAGIRPDATNGGVDQSWEDLSIDGFYDNINIGEIWWGSEVVNVRCNNAVRGDLRCIATGGQSIQNTFVNFYSNNPGGTGILLSGVKGWSFITPNMGLRSDRTGTAAAYVDVSTVCKDVVFLNPNFESSGGSIADNQAGVVIRSTSEVTMINPKWIANFGETGTAYEIETRDSANLTLIMPTYFQQGLNIAKAIARNTSTINIIGGDETGIAETATATVVMHQAAAKNGWLASGSEAVAAGGFVDTGLGRTLVDYSIDLVPDSDAIQDVMPQVSAAFGDGTFKVRYIRISDGAQIFPTRTILWRAR